MTFFVYIKPYYTIKHSLITKQKQKYINTVIFHTYHRKFDKTGSLEWIVFMTIAYFLATPTSVKGMLEKIITTDRTKLAYLVS